MLIDQTAPPAAKPPQQSHLLGCYNDRLENLKELRKPARQSTAWEANLWWSFEDCNPGLSRHFLIWIWPFSFFFISHLFIYFSVQVNFAVLCKRRLLSEVNLYHLCSNQVQLELILQIWMDETNDLKPWDWSIMSSLMCKLHGIEVFSHVLVNRVACSMLCKLI